MNAELLVAIPMDPERRSRLAEQYTVHHTPDAESRAATIAAIGPKIRAVVTNGRSGMSGEHLRAMPNLEIVCVIGAGYEALDVAVAREMGIVIASGAGTNAPAVADHALALLFSAVRGIVPYDRVVREGGWKQPSMQRPEIFGKNLGVLGYGHIGRRIAERGGGFGMKVAYHTRTQRDGVPHHYFPTLTELAAWSDFLAIACPGGKSTYHIVNAEVLAALGPSGFVVNVARGSVIDTDALIAALNAETLAGAALDVVEGEPAVPAALIGAKNIIITPHIGGGSPESKRASVDRVLESLEAHFAGRAPAFVI